MENWYTEYSQAGFSDFAKNKKQNFFEILLVPIPTRAKYFWTGIGTKLHKEMCDTTNKWLFAFYAGIHTEISLATI